MGPEIASLFMIFGPAGRVPAVEKEPSVLLHCEKATYSYCILASKILISSNDCYVEFAVNCCRKNASN